MNGLLRLGTRCDGRACARLADNEIICATVCEPNAEECGETGWASPRDLRASALNRRFDERPCATVLPVEAEGALQEARIVDDSADFAEAGRGGDGQARIGEIDVIEEVVGFSAEYEALVLGDCEALD